MKMKKTMVGLGAATAVIAPIATVVSCGSGKGVVSHNLLPTYTGEADQLIALGIRPDYYPVQLNEPGPYKYLTDPGHYMQLQKKDFRDAFAAKIAKLMPKEVGTGWWNQDALGSNEKGSDPAYWQQMQGNVLLYEHYLLDDDRKIIDKSNAPKHMIETAIETNFRSSRDPFTRIPKTVFWGWDLTDAQIESIIKGPAATADIEVTLKFKKQDVKMTVGKGDALIIKKLREAHKSIAKDGTAGWVYNDWFFVDHFHRMFLDNSEYQGSDFVNWLLDSTSENVFANEQDGTAAEGYIQKLFDASTFTQEEIGAGVGPVSKQTHGHGTTKHHPIYEQQDGKIGAAPMFEGGMRDNMLYLFNVSWQVQNLVTTGTPYGEQYLKDLDAGKVHPTSGVKTRAEAVNTVNWLKTHLAADQLASMRHAFDNANKISTQLHARLQNMKNYFKEIFGATSDATKMPSFGLMTIAPGHGMSTIQSNSKYSFIYRELGFKQPLPDNLATLSAGAASFDRTKHMEKDKDGDMIVGGGATDAVKKAVGKGAMFNMDDNGWFWTIGETGNIDLGGQLAHFKDKFDIGVIAARDINYKNDVVKNKKEAAIKELWEATGRPQDLSTTRVNYDLWNEGLKTPFVMHMILDDILNRTETYAKAKGLDITHFTDDRTKALNWGDFFTKDFVK